jgi:HK97 family phage major capsid protein
MSSEFISTTKAGALISTEYSKNIIQGALDQSKALQMMKRLPDMTKKQKTLNILDSLVSAYFVTGAITTSAPGIKKMTSQAWANKYIYAEEIACIVPISDETLADADFDIWGQLQPAIQAAFGKVIDGAIFFETGKPTAWRDGLVHSATDAGNVVALGTGVDVAEDVANMLASIEAEGYEASGFAAPITFKNTLRLLRDNDGHPLMYDSFKEDVGPTFYGSPIQYMKNGAWDSAQALLLAGAFNEAVYSVRQDLTVKLFTEGIIQDPATGNIAYNLMQQDMRALRFVMRLGWELPNPVNQLQAVAASRCPFAVLTP